VEATVIIYGVKQNLLKWAIYSSWSLGKEEEAKNLKTLRTRSKTAEGAETNGFNRPVTLSSVLLQG
jgi:hypothetical protein